MNPSLFQNHSYEHKATSNALIILESTCGWTDMRGTLQKPCSRELTVPCGGQRGGTKTWAPFARLSAGCLIVESKNTFKNQSYLIWSDILRFCRTVVESWRTLTTRPTGFRRKSGRRAADITLVPFGIKVFKKTLTSISQEGKHGFLNRLLHIIYWGMMLSLCRHWESDCIPAHTCRVRKFVINTKQYPVGSRRMQSKADDNNSMCNDSTEREFTYLSIFVQCLSNETICIRKALGTRKFAYADDSVLWRMKDAALKETTFTYIKVFPSRMSSFVE